MELFYELIRDNGGRPDIYSEIKNEFLDTNEFMLPALYTQNRISMLFFVIPILQEMKKLLLSR